MDCRRDLVGIDAYLILVAGGMLMLEKCNGDND